MAKVARNDPTSLLEEALEKEYATAYDNVYRKLKLRPKEEEVLRELSSYGHRLKQALGR